jgi:hypothetical protein
MSAAFVGTITAFWAGMGYSALLKTFQKSCPLRPVFRWAGNCLLVGIGLKAGLSVAGARAGPGSEWVPISLLALAGMGWGVIMPRLLAPRLARWLQWSPCDAALLAGTYGSVSVMTFALAVAFFDQGPSPVSGLFSVLLLVMELPALLSVVAKWGSPQAVACGETPDAPSLPWRGSVLGHVCGSSVVQLMVGSAVVGGAVASFGQEHLVRQALQLLPLCIPVFLFGQGASLPDDWRSLFRVTHLRLLIVGVLLPVLQGLLGFCLAWMVGCSVEGIALFAILMSSASYLAAPALLGKFFSSDKLPLCTALSLTVTFPFNVLVGIQLWDFLARGLAS